MSKDQELTNLEQLLDRVIQEMPGRPEEKLYDSEELAQSLIDYVDADEETVRGEHQRQGVAQVSVANAVASLRLCTTLDWQQYVETVSLVEHALQQDPAGAYAQMDFRSRDRYRHAVEELAAPGGEGDRRHERAEEPHPPVADDERRARRQVGREESQPRHGRRRALRPDGPPPAPRTGPQ